MNNDSGTPSWRGSRVRRRVSGSAVLLAVLATGTGVSWAASVAVSDVERAHAARTMDQYTETIDRAVTNETARYRETLTDLGAAIGAQSTFTAAAFTAITARLDRQRLPGAGGVTFAVAATDAQTSAVQARWREHGATGLHLVPVGTGVEHMFKIFARTFDETAPTTGRDLSQLPEVAQALRQARASGQVTASTTYVLLRDRALPVSARPLSFMLATAVYGAPGTPDAGEFRGWLLLAMRAEDFIRETLRTSARDAVTVTLTDLSAAEATTVAASGPAHSRDAGLGRERTLIVAQRTWHLLVRPTPRLVSATDRHLPVVTGAIGMVLTVLIGALVDARRRALNRVALATASLHADIAKREKVEAQLRLRERELHQLALHDALTGLANRTLLYERLGHALATHRRDAGIVAVLFVDLDGFKQVNDRYGHGGGDTVLTAVADRLRQSVRASDTVARFGGDEFAILVERLTDPDDVTIVAERVVHALQAPVDIGGHPVSIGCSVGVAVREQDDCTAEDLLRQADAAMYAAKTACKNRFHLALTARLDETQTWPP